MKCLTSQVCKLCNMNFPGGLSPSMHVFHMDILIHAAGEHRRYIYLFFSFIVVGFHI